MVNPISTTPPVVFPESSATTSFYQKFLGPNATTAEAAAFIQGLNQLVGNAISADNNMAEEGNKVLEQAAKETE